MTKIKRAYDSPEETDGKRILVDRLWPRGLRKDEVMIHEWKKDLAPSHKLRKWFGHDPEKWGEFKKKYREELRDKEELLKILVIEAEKEIITLVYSAKDEYFNNAVVLKEVLEAITYLP